MPAKIISRGLSPEGKKNWDRIFKKRKKNVVPLMVDDSRVIPMVVDDSRIIPMTVSNDNSDFWLDEEDDTKTDS